MNTFKKSFVAVLVLGLILGTGALTYAESASTESTGEGNRPIQTRLRQHQDTNMQNKMMQNSGNGEQGQGNKNGRKGHVDRKESIDGKGNKDKKGNKGNKDGKGNGNGVDKREERQKNCPQNMSNDVNKDEVNTNIPQNNLVNQQNKVNGKKGQGQMMQQQGKNSMDTMSSANVK